MKTLFLKIVSLLKREDGTAAIESCMFSPLLVLSALAISDIGDRASSRMDLDQALRAGSQVAMLNTTNDVAIEGAALMALGESVKGTVDLEGNCSINKTCIDVTHYCECSDGLSSPCDELCPTLYPPSAFVSISVKRRIAGLLFPDTHVHAKTEVRLR